MDYHKPVLLNECMDGLAINPNGIYVDVTFGGGGHSKEILNHLKDGRLIAFDQDADAVANVVADKRLLLIHDNFSNISYHLHKLNCKAIDGLLADLGISSHQINEPQRGFSTRFESVLDMRMNQEHSATARQILNTYSLQQLQNMFSKYGEIKNAKQLANAIIKSRSQSAIDTTNQFKDAIKNCLPFNKEHQYLAQVFQALRIEVNNEMQVLSELLMQSGTLVKSGGRLVVIAYHSLEDRLVKNLINSGNTEGLLHKDMFGNIVGKTWKAINKKPITPSPEELTDNPRSRSARLRIAQKV